MGFVAHLRGLVTRASPPAAAGTRYRGDIDGLRAIAVLTVVFYHYGVPPFTGGFVGVDVFFVISGFLITSLIHAEMAEKRFSVAQFYERRIRRIFPALFTVLAASTVLSLIFLFPNDLRHFAQSLEATIVFGSNFLFRNIAGYWDVAARHKPLLHTWSLAVEEQYYLLFPAILFSAGKGGEWLQRAIIAVTFRGVAGDEHRGCPSRSDVGVLSASLSRLGADAGWIDRGRRDRRARQPHPARNVVLRWPCADFLRRVRIFAGHAVSRRRGTCTVSRHRAS